MKVTARAFGRELLSLQLERDDGLRELAGAIGELAKAAFAAQQPDVDDGELPFDGGRATDCTVERRETTEWLGEEPYDEEARRRAFGFGGNVSGLV